MCVLLYEDFKGLEGYRLLPFSNRTKFWCFGKKFSLGPVVSLFFYFSLSLLIWTFEILDAEFHQSRSAWWFTIKNKTNQVTHFFSPFRRFVFFSFDPFPWKGESHQWDCPRYTSSVVRHLLLYLVCFTLFGYFHTVSLSSSFVWFFGRFSPGGGLLFHFLHLGLWKGRQERDRGGVSCVCYIVLDFFLV